MRDINAIMADVVLYEFAGCSRTAVHKEVEA